MLLKAKNLKVWDAYMFGRAPTGWKVWPISDSWMRFMDRSPSYRLLQGCLFLIPLVFCLVGGCATITRGGSETLIIESDPSGAKATLSSGNVCTTPCWIAMKRTHDYHVKIEKAGYQTVDTNVLRRVAGGGVAGIAGNVIFGGVIGVGVDLATGSTKELTPNPLRVKLEPVEPLRAPSYPASAAIIPAAFVEPVGARNTTVAKTINLSPTAPPSTLRCAVLGVDLTKLTVTALGGMDGVTGAMVTVVAPLSAAAGAGIQQWDILLRVGDTSVDDPGDVQRAVAQIAPGAIIPIKLSRQARPLWVSVQF
jgi:hypothetical protein